MLNQYLLEFMGSLIISYALIFTHENKIRLVENFRRSLSPFFAISRLNGKGTNLANITRNHPQYLLPCTHVVCHGGTVCFQCGV